MKRRNGKIRRGRLGRRVATVEGDSIAGKPRQRVEEGRLRRVATMATYLRSALGRASEKLVVGGVEKTDERGREEGELQNQEDNDRIEKAGEGFVGRKDGEEADRCESETASSSGRTEEAVEHQILDGEEEETKENEDEETFTLHVDRPESVEAAEEADQVEKVWAYCDVLLQPDARGLGLNLHVAALSVEPSRTTNGKVNQAVVVASFRRLHGSDVGPAEASGQIRVGDVLHSVDGHRIATLEAVSNRLTTLMEGGARPFVLLRFLRQSTEDGAITDAVHSSSPVDPHTSERFAVDFWASRPDVAMLIRELVVRNQSLEEQVLASHLKQDEQRIQLEQLHALYAKTQLENGSAFSLPKPLSMRAPFNMRRPSGTSKANTSLSTAAARLIGVVTPAQYDVEYAVNAERERLTRQFEQRLETQKCQLQNQHDSSVRAVQAAADKKIRMLEFSVKQLLQAPPATTSGDPAPASAHVQILRHQLLHRKHECDGSNGNQREPIHDCVMCLLQRETHCVAAKKAGYASEADALRAQILPILEEYDGAKATRKSQSMETKILHEQSISSNQNEDTE